MRVSTYRTYSSAPPFRSCYTFHTCHLQVGMVDSVGEISSDMSKRFGRHVQLVHMEPEEPVDYSRLLRWLF